MSIFSSIIYRYFAEYKSIFSPLIVKYTKQLTHISSFAIIYQSFDGERKNMTMFQIVITKLISLILSVVFIPFSLLTCGIDLVTSGGHTDTAKTNIVGLGAIFRSQGMTTDGEDFYFSSKTTLIRTKSDAKTVIDADYSAIPDELKELGIAHIGGLSYYNGYIYAGMEDSKVWDYPIVGIFDAETLDFVDYYILDCETVTRGLPWVCVDPETGWLYCTDHSKVPTKLLVYDAANEMEFDLFRYR